MQEIYVEDIVPENSVIIKIAELTPMDIALLVNGVPTPLSKIGASTSADLKYVPVEVRLVIDNPNSESVTIDKLILNMFDDEGHSLGRGEIQDIQITPGMNSATVKVDIRIDKMGYEILRKLSGYEAVAEISGSAYTGDEEIPFSSEGELLPQLPEPPVPLPPLPPFPVE